MDTWHEELPHLQVGGGGADVVQLSVNMLFTDQGRFDRFAAQRLDEFERVDVPLEVRFGFNGDIAEEAVRSVAAGRPYPITAVWTGRNHIPYGRNLLTRQSRGQWRLICDDDCQISPGGVECMLAQLQRYPVGVVGLQSFGDGRSFKPRSWEPTVTHPGFDGLRIVSGVHGMAFVTHGALLERFPLSLVRTLRGEWVDWFTRLWRCGIPSAYCLHPDYYITDQCLPQSATRSPQRLRYVLISLLSVGYEYHVRPELLGYRLLRDQYLTPNLSADDAADPEPLWRELLRTARNGFAPDPELAGCSPFTRQAVNEALSHCRRHRSELEAFRSSSITPYTTYEVGPFEIFDPENAGLLAQALERAPSSLTQFVAAGSACR